MLSIRFADGHEWWVSNQVFERLFSSALEHNQLAPALEEWLHVADANGGMSLADLEPEVARDLTTGLRAAAVAELAQVTDADPHTLDGTYETSLKKLVAMLDELDTRGSPVRG